MQEANELITILIIIGMFGLFTLIRHVINMIKGMKLRLEDVEQELFRIKQKLVKSNGREH